MKKHLVIFTKPFDSSFFEHGLELLITMYDLEFDVKVVIACDLLEALYKDCSDVKANRLKQLELFEIKTYGLCLDKSKCKDEFLFVESIDKSIMQNLIRSVDTVLTF